MNKLRHKLLRLTKLRYEMFPVLLDNMRVSDDLALDDPVLAVLKCHLLSEVVLDRLLTLALGPNGHAVLSVRLSYAQKLNVASRCVLVENYELLPDFVVGSLRRLNRIRNRLAHELGATVKRDEVLALFMDVDHLMPVDPLTADVALLLYHYTPFIFGHMLPKFEVASEEE